MKTQYYAASSLDGFIAGSDHSLDWLLRFDVEETSYPEFINQVGAIAMGSSTYEWIVRHLVKPESDTPKPWPYDQTVWVFTSRSLSTVDGTRL